MIKAKNIHWIFFILINFQIISYTLFINQFNLPDGVLHLLAFENTFTNNVPTSLSNYLSNFDFYNISIIKNFIIKIYPSIKNDCLWHWSQIYISDTCNNIIDYNENFSFGNSEHLFNYSNSYLLNDLKIAHIIYLFFLNLFFYLFIITKFDDNLKYTALIFLIFPSVLNSISYISPNISSTYFQIILFYFFINKFFIKYFILSIFLFNTDLQNISNLYIICALFMFLLLNLFLNYKIRFYQVFIIYSLILLILYILKDQGVISILIQQFSSIINIPLYEPYNYLNIGDSNFFKSLIIFGTSLYYIGGSMSHIAYLLEYLFFIVIFIFFVLNFVKKDVLFNSMFSNLSTFYFLSGIFTFLSLLIVFSNFNQGRYGFFLISPILFFLFSYFKDSRELFSYTFLIFFILNNFKIVNFINSGI